MTSGNMLEIHVYTLYLGLFWYLLDFSSISINKINQNLMLSSLKNKTTVKKFPKISVSFLLQPHLWSSTPAPGPYRRTCTSRWPEHPEGSPRSSNHSEGSPRRTESFSSPSLERSPGWTAALTRAGRKILHNIQITGTSDELVCHCFALERLADKNLTRLVNSLLQKSLSECVSALCH